VLDDVSARPRHLHASAIHPPNRTILRRILSLLSSHSIKAQTGKKSCQPPGGPQSRNITPSFECRHAYGSMEDALAGIGVDPPRVALVDIGLPGLSGRRRASRLAAANPWGRSVSGAGSAGNHPPPDPPGSRA
jgi:hypothetical protein